MLGRATSLFTRGVERNESPCVARGFFHAGRAGAWDRMTGSRRALAPLGRTVGSLAVCVASCHRAEQKDGRRDEVEPLPHAHAPAVHFPSRGTNDKGTFTSTQPPVGAGNFAERNILRTQLETSAEWIASCTTEAAQTLPWVSRRTLIINFPWSDALPRSACS